MVGLHGGSVSAHSDGLGRGATFVVRLPCSVAQVENEDGEAPSSAKRTHAGRRVLVVDDNREAAELLVEALRHAGHEVMLAYDPGEALAHAVVFAPDVAVLDVGLPQMSGHELGGLLRERCSPAPAAHRFDRVRPLHGPRRQRARGFLRAPGQARRSARSARRHRRLTDERDGVRARQMAPSRSHSPKRSPIISVGRFVFALGMVGMMLASATKSPSTPRTRPRAVDRAVRCRRRVRPSARCRTGGSRSRTRCEIQASMRRASSRTSLARPENSARALAWRATAPPCASSIASTARARSRGVDEELASRCVGLRARVGARSEASPWPRGLPTQHISADERQA